VLGGHGGRLVGDVFRRHRIDRCRRLQRLLLAPRGGHHQRVQLEGSGRQLDRLERDVVGADADAVDAELLVAQRGDEQRVRARFHAHQPELALHVGHRGVDDSSRRREQLDLHAAERLADLGVDHAPAHGDLGQSGLLTATNEQERYHRGDEPTP
jgi:hypothetical protein